MTGHSDEALVETAIREMGLTGPRVTSALIDASIKDQAFYVFPGTCLTICCLTLQNGFNVIGESACVSPENFDADIGRMIAFRNAREKIWPLAGYALLCALAGDRFDGERPL